MLYKKNPKLLNQFQYCEREAVPLLVIVGEEEKARGGVKIRDTRTRQEVSQPHIRMSLLQQVVCTHASPPIETLNEVLKPSLKY